MDRGVGVVADEAKDFPVSLLAAFNESWKRQVSLDKGEDVATSVADVLVSWERCEALLQPALPNLFSRNEALEDFNTSALKYLLVPYYLGGALMQSPGVTTRAYYLKKARAYFTAFLAELERHEGLTREDLNIWHRETPLQPTARRTERVNQARRERELHQALQLLHKRRGPSGGEDVCDEGHADEEMEREIWLNTIQISVLKAIHELESIEKELPLAERMAITETAQELDAKRAQQERHRATPPEQDIKLVPQGEGSVLSKAATREQKQREVFRPSWALPSMTVEEAAAIEMRFAAKPTPEARTEEEEGEDDDSDEAVFKAREWDEYKDTHPSGWGNRINQG